MNYFSHWPYVIWCAILIVGPSPAWSEADRINSFKCFDRFDRQTNKGISLEEAVEACNLVLRDNPSDLQRYGAYLHRGLANFELKDYRQSAADFDVFLSHLDGLQVGLPTIELVHERNAAANFLLKNYPKAISELDHAEAVSKDAEQKEHRPDLSYATPSWHYAIRGDAAFFSGQYAAAVDQYERFQQLRESRPEFGVISDDGFKQLQNHLKIARQMAGNPNHAPSTPPVPAPSTAVDACKLYPNLCP
jgi:tetratricopeptide (TPR) repeat protein